MTTTLRFKFFICLVAICGAGCTRHAEYSVKNTDIEQLVATDQHSGFSIKVLPLAAAPIAHGKWRVHSDQVRLTLPHFSGANELLSVASGGEALSERIVLRLEFERYSPLESGRLTPVYNPRLSIPCAGWSIEVDNRTHPIDRDDCGEVMEFGDAAANVATIAFRVPGGPHDEFTVRSPSWRIDWILKSDGVHEYPEHLILYPPSVIFERTSKWGALDFAIR